MQPYPRPIAWQSFLHNADPHSQRIVAHLRRLSTPTISPAGPVAIVGDFSAGSTSKYSPSDTAGRTSSAHTLPEIGFHRDPASQVARLWKAYFRDPSQWWDKRDSEINPNSPDFKHKITKELLWIDGLDNPKWVAGLLQKTDFANNGMHKAKSQELPDNSSWELLSLEEALTYLERMHEPPSVAKFTCILHKCRKKKNLAYAQRLHAYMCKSGMESHISLGNHLVPMLVEVGSVWDAQQVFNRLIDRNEYSWTSLISGYIECGESQHALILFEKMQEDHVHPSGHTFVAILKACARLKDVERGQKIHAEIAIKGLERDLFVGCTLVDMYAKCGSLIKAREVFDKLPLRDAVSWNALITGYAKSELGEEALNCFEQMQLEGILPDLVTFVRSLKACGSIGAVDKGRAMHGEIARKGLLEREPLVGNALVDMYAKCGVLAKAREVFDKLPVQNVVSWTALIQGYVEHGLGKEALVCFEQMQLEGVSPDALTFVCSLKACGNTGAIDKGREMHADIAREGLFERDPFVGSALVDMYAKCGLLAKAQEVFDNLPVRNVVSWTALIVGYANHGLGEDSLNCFKGMQSDGVAPDALTLVCSLKACGSIGAIDKGQEIHAEIVRIGLETDLLVGSTLVDMYAKCGLLAKAQEAFDKLSVRDVVVWTALIAGYAEHGLGETALDGFKQMQLEGFFPNGVTLASSLKACGSIGAIDKGREIHADITGHCLLESDPLVLDTLVDMYAKCGLLADAEDVFSKLSLRNLVSWTAIIAGYTEHGLGEEALDCYEQMQLEGLSPDALTFVCILKNCGCIGAIDKGQEIHDEIARKGLLQDDPVVGSALVDMFVKCGSLMKAREVFDKLPVRNVASWTALIAGYAKHGLGEEALNCYEWMQLEGLSPDALTFVCSLKACGSIGAVDKGQEMHAEIARRGLERDLLVGSTLVDMHVKCGSLAKAWETFYKLPVRDVVTWTALIAGYARLGESENVFHMLEQMRGEGIRPNGVTFLSVLAVCSHAGLVDQGQYYFEAMSKDYGIMPTIEHQACMIDLLGRAGQLDKVVVMMNKMPLRPNLVMWHIVLGASRKCGNVELGRKAFESAVQLDEKDAAAYVLMSSIYADAHMQEDVKKIEAMRIEVQAWKKPVWSWWIEAG